MAEIWYDGGRIAERAFDRHPEVGDILELQLNGEFDEYIVKRKAVFYDRNGQMVERIIVELYGPLG